MYNELSEKDFSSKTSSIVYENEQAQSTLMRNVYIWMTLALAVSGATAWYVANSYNLLNAIFSSSWGFLGLVVAELALVWILAGMIQKLSFLMAGIMFVVYSVVNGLTLSCIFVAYTTESIASTFFITAGMFAAMALIGTFIKKDLSGLRRFLLMALIGLIIASVVNIFLGSSTMYWIITYVGVLLFTALTVYDAQQIKNMIALYGNDVNESTQKIALLGSLMLYLDFVNLFLYMLRIFGNRD
ncbi:MAG: Bax inhibitor-1/YccA family protein [Paludibacteraceae bacterium]|nr:Bax inhibitor-1/YccA family protein [Paludibacteraceae bacterium]